jgi:leader peptidase (prepilin peptidase) / N-methyltransferase
VNILAGAAVGAIAGGVLPAVIARIPDRAPVDGEPAPTPHRTIAAAPRLAWLLGGMTAAVWATLAGFAEVGVALPAYLFVAWLGVGMSYVDVREHRLPDWLTYPALAGAAVFLAAAALDSTWAAYGRAWLGALALAVGYLVLALLRPGELGLGDVKLAASLGLLLGWIGWGYVLLGAFAGFLLGGLFSLILLATRRATRRSHIPFGPFMLAGALVAVAWGAAILDAYTRT